MSIDTSPQLVPNTLLTKPLAPQRKRQSHHQCLKNRLNSRQYSMISVLVSTGASPQCVPQHPTHQASSSKLPICGCWCSFILLAMSSFMLLNITALIMLPGLFSTFRGVPVMILLFFLYFLYFPILLRSAVSATLCSITDPQSTNFPVFRRSPSHIVLLGSAVLTDVTS